MENSRYLSVGALTKYLKYKFDQDPYLTRVFIKGELSNVKRHTSGHVFFSLKDGNAVIRAVMFARSAGGLKFDPEDGQSVLAQGRISIYESSGQYQIYVDAMEIDGIGRLFEQLEKDKKELAQKGYFNPEHKKALPAYPEAITIVSSQTGAAIRDMLTTLERRFPVAEVKLINTLMQGSQSKDGVLASLAYADSLNSDVVILARGGGSIEDLWTFNEREVALKVFEMNTPVVTGIGHETDTTLVDFVADVRAATPTAAAEVAVPDRRDIKERITQHKLLISKRISQNIDMHRKALDSFANYYKLKHPELLYDQQTEKLAELRTNLDTRMNVMLRERRYQYASVHERVGYKSPEPVISRYQEILAQTKARLDDEVLDKVEGSKKQLVSSIDLLNSLSPTNILLRGYSFTTKDGNIVRETGEVEVGDHIETTLGNGRMTSKVTEVNNSGRE